MRFLVLSSLSTGFGTCVSWLALHRPLVSSMSGEVLLKLESGQNHMIDLALRCESRCFSILFTGRGRQRLLGGFRYMAPAELTIGSLLPGTVDGCVIFVKAAVDAGRGLK